jgi:nucleoid DNA-binding protein
VNRGDFKNTIKYVVNKLVRLKLNRIKKKYKFVYVQLSTYIKDLLYRYECVIIPGFGAFLTQYRSARIDEQTNTFFPPGKVLSFNRQLQTNDGLLANYVASVEQSTYDTALQKIRNFTGKLSLRLSEGETVHLSGIGDFHLNSERSVQFDPIVSENFSATSFGLISFASSEIQREAHSTSVSEQDKNIPVVTLAQPQTTKPYLKYAAIGLVALGLSGIGGLKIYEGQVQKHNFAEREKANTLVEHQIEEATFVIENPLPTLSLTIPKQQGRYHIVAGAFRIEENAAKKMRQLQEKGYSPILLGQNRYGLHQVIYNSFENRLEALQNLSRIKRTENPDAWLLVKELSK